MIQVLTEAGWSILCFDYVARTGQFVLVIIYWMICHSLVVHILAALMKALIWEAYSAVQNEFH
jgi:hypothetical protein